MIAEYYAHIFPEQMKPRKKQQAFKARSYVIQLGSFATYVKKKI